MRKHRQTLESINNTGFGANSTTEGHRISNKDGTVNIQKTGLALWKRVSLYHSLLRMKRAKFLLSIFLFYCSLNVIFAFIYLLVGVEHLHGSVVPQEDILGDFLTAFFFSSQTLTTVGYGHISPSGLVTNSIAALESFLGILSFAMVTGLLYGRFTRPKAYLLFSDNALIAPHKGGQALMFRTASYKNNHLTDVEAQLTIALHVEENGNKVTRFYPLKLEISKVNSLALSWTLVHQITEDSPLHQMSYDDMRDTDFEILVFLKGFDDHFSNTVQQRTSYTFEEIVYGAKFLPMFKRATDGTATIVDLGKINALERVTLHPQGSSPINV